MSAAKNKNSAEYCTTRAIFAFTNNRSKLGNEKVLSCSGPIYGKKIRNNYSRQVTRSCIVERSEI